VYWLGNEPDSAEPYWNALIPYLLWQFDLLSPFWQRLQPVGTSGTKALRELVKIGVALHKIRGTPRALKLILQALGYGARAPAAPTVRILEGQDSWGGSYWPPEQGWAVYRVVLPTSGIRIAELPDLHWDPRKTYRPGDIVTYPTAINNGVIDTVNRGSFYVAATVPPVGAPPKYFEVGNVGRTIHEDGTLNAAENPTNAFQIGDMRWLSEVGALTTRYWNPMSPLNGVLYRLLTPLDISLIREACVFFAPVSRWLDLITFDIELAIHDFLPPFSDSVTAPTGVAVPVFDALPPLYDTMIVAMPSMADAITFVPTHRGAWRHGAGFTYSKAKIRMIDNIPRIV